MIVHPINENILRSVEWAPQVARDVRWLSTYVGYGYNSFVLMVELPAELPAELPKVIQ